MNKLTTGGDFIQTNDIVAMYDKDSLLRSGFFEMTGAKGHEGLSMRDSLKNILASNGFSPIRADGTVGKHAKMWRVESLPIFKKVIDDAISKLTDCDNDAQSIIVANVDTILRRAIRDELAERETRIDAKLDAKLDALLENIKAIFNN